MDFSLPDGSVEGVEVVLVRAGVRARKELGREVVEREERERAKRLVTGVVVPEAEEERVGVEELLRFREERGRARVKERVRLPFGGGAAPFP